VESRGLTLRERIVQAEGEIRDLRRYIAQSKAECLEEVEGMIRDHLRDYHANHKSMGEENDG
jgi:hypothetical protein